MTAVVSAVSIIAYAVSLIKFRGKWIQQQIVFLVIYLIGLTLVGELDVLLPIYFVVSLIPFLRHIRKISVFTGAILFYFMLYLVYGVVNQNTVGSIVTFIAKMWQFIIFFVVYDANIVLCKENYKKIVFGAAIVETVLGVYLMINSKNIDANGLVRLVSNSQPITGNASTVILPVSAYFYILNRSDSKKTKWLLLVSLFMLVWIVLSGTRGYTLEFAATMVLIFYDYFTTTRVGNISKKNRAFVATVLVMISAILIIGVPAIFEKLESILRLKSDVGIRTFENAAVIEFIKTTSIPVTLFGIGLGGKAGNYPEMRSALYEQFSRGMWNEAHYYITSPGVAIGSDCRKGHGDV